MFLSPGEQVSVENLLHGIVTLSGNDASVVLAECIAGTEEAFANVMNENGKRLGLTNSQFGNSNGWPDEGRTYVTARDLATLARAEIENHPQLYKKFYSQTSFTWGKTLGSGADITQANRNPLLGRVPGADGLKTGHTDEAGYGFTGSAEQNGRRLVMVIAGLDSFNQRIEESVRLMQWGFNAWQTKPLYKAGAAVGSAKVQLGGDGEVALVAPARPGGDHSRRRAVQDPIDQDPLPGAGQGADRQGPAHRRPGGDDVRCGRAGHAAGRGRGGRRGGLFHPRLDRPQATSRNGLSRQDGAGALHQPGGRGRGRQIHPA